MKLWGDHMFGRKTEQFFTKVVGVSHRNKDGSRRQEIIDAFCEPGMTLILRREPLNPHDSNAIGVWIKGRALIIFRAELQIGYLSREVAAEPSEHLDRGGIVDAFISDVTGGTRSKTTRGVNISIELR